MDVIPVYAQPAARHAAAAALKQHGLVVVSAETAISDAPGTSKHAERQAARQTIRQSLAEILALSCQLDLHQVQFFSSPGQALRADIPGYRFGLSLSHEPGLSLAAICATGAVGVDIMRVDESLDWEPVAQLYLGAEAAENLGRQPASRQAHAFAQAWTAHEAGLKCLGLAITEWSADLSRALAQCQPTSLLLPDGYVGAVSTAI
ncbi:4'-phosphopantetheinyl transferase family protein [Undibacterium terreum]|uniref:4'-phosphopantetheinyl transferase domain-containing protein n=1 Tax=Undibacterium terreum TaxID=1224302 RepID=A0A916U3H4_9BURK|nr:4'-phosphopantetheinyl transferase superfamily protein [Undibacterium terreum]GGC58168.1 hypothetical protein GCM10011396_01250 [Undibacterium terreum]